MERKPKNPGKECISPGFCYVYIGGRKIKVELPMTGETLGSILKAQAGKTVGMTPQMSIIEKPIDPERFRAQLRRYEVLILPSRN